MISPFRLSTADILATPAIFRFLERLDGAPG
jgi:hypothetical protein